MPLSCSFSFHTFSLPSTMSLLLLLLILFCTSALTVSLVTKQLAPTALITAPALLVATIHLLLRATTGVDAASRLLTLMLRHPARAIQMFIQTIIRRLPLPTWLAEWLNNLSIAVTEICNTVNDIAYEATATGVHVDKYSLVMGHLCETFEDFVTSSTCIGEIAQRAIATIIEVRELSFHTRTRVEDIYHHAFDTDENVSWLRGDLLQMEQVIEQHTAHIADINLQLALNTIHVRVAFVSSCFHSMSLTQVT
jgi:signal transduction histidine kinase